MGWSEKDFCIKCGNGGKVLACSDSCCPLAVHEKCMGFPAKFDETGYFYCPYCSYRRAVEESRQAREKALLRKKALSTFIDMEMIYGNEQAHEIGQSKGKESTQLQNACKGLDWAIVPENACQLEKDKQDEDFTREGTIIVSLPKEYDIALLGKQDNALSSKYVAIVRPSNFNDCLVVVGHRTSSGPIVACGNDDVSCEEGTTQQFEIVEIGRKVQLEHSTQLDDEQPVQTVKNHLEDNHFGDSSEAEKQGAENYFSSPAERVGNDANLFEENEDTAAEEEEMEDVQGSTSTFALDPAPPMDLKEKRGIETDYSVRRDSTVVSFSKGVKQNDENRGHPVDVHCLRSSRNLSAALKDNAEQIEINASSKLKQLTGPSPGSSRNLFPSVRRKKLPWTDDEEEMLKEGVQKFSTTVNKNIPWRKILEFGRHVFHGTRTPPDLKDKWRKILAKEGCIYK